MNSISLLQMVVQQTWQVALLAGLVWFLTRSIGRERPHLSHMLWALVLVKCITPPIWSSPIGLFSQISNYVGIVENREPVANALSDSRPGSRNLLVPTVGIEWTNMDASADAASPPVSPSVYWDSTVRAITIVWISGTSLVGLFSIVRFMIFVRLICRRTCETPPEVARCVARLNQRLGLQRQVGVRVVECLIGPAVYGLWKPVILLPQAVIAGRTEQQLEPLLAHEMVHVRRGDLWLAMIQSLACTVGWFHPLVWLASRQVTIESERCCDEETIALLRCKPATYAHSLLDVLELKHLLQVAPALPGVRPVDITSSRLERIMRLGQGCRSRSPWWIWCIALVSAIAVLPGAEYVTAQTPEPKKMDESAVAPKKEPSMAPEASPLPPRSLPAPQGDPNEPQARPEDFVQADFTIVEVASKTEESKQMFAWLAEQSIYRSEQSVPILSKIPYLGRLFKNQGVQLASATSGITTRRSQTALLSSDQTAEFIEKFLDPDQHTYLSRPQMMTINGNTASVAIGQFEGGSKETISAGYYLSITPTIIDKDTIRLEYESTRSKLAGPKDVDEQLIKDQSAKDLSKSIQKSTVKTSVQFRLDQTLVIASQQNFVDGPYEIIVVKCSLPYAKQNSDASPESSK